MHRRFAPPYLPQHVVQRGNDRCRIFHADEQRAGYLDCLAHAARKYACAIHAYVLMDNHVHLLATPGAVGGLSKMMQWLGSRYTTYLNEGLGRTGTLWEGRFYSSTVTTDRYLLVCHRYIELNPVRARLTREPADFQWSSHRHNALGAADPLITEHALYRSLGSTPRAQCDAYRALFASDIPDADLQAIRGALDGRKCLGDAPAGHAARKRGRPRQTPRNSAQSQINSE